jgi:4-diphosphocytidyl-2-C-methyl-D-erythritol kinase
MTAKSYAKVNIFLKIAGKRNDYHELVSRFVRVKTLYDTISFKKRECNDFVLEGNFGCDMKKNTIYKAYVLLAEYSLSVKEYFKHHAVLVNKQIPEFAGLGGGSSNAAAFMLMVNRLCNLGLSKDELCKMGINIGADVPFFVYEYDSANVTGIGEKVEKFEEKVLTLETITPKVQCNTGAIFNTFRKNFYQEVSDFEAQKLLSLSSVEILKQLTIEQANDLYLPAVNEYPSLKEYSQNGWFFSGSGSSFFKVIKENE